MNEKLEDETGTDGTVHEAAWLGLLDEWSKQNACEISECKVTFGYKLGANYFILRGLEITMTVNWLTVITVV